MEEASEKKEAVVIWSTTNAHVVKQSNGMFWVEVPPLGDFGPIAARPDTVDGEGIALVLYATRQADV